MPGEGGSTMTPQEAIKNLEKPKGRWGTILATTPIIMTVLATVFAGLSSSEMTQAMFHRSLASQQQSKAGDQWAFFQAKRIRVTTLETTIEVLQTIAHGVPVDAAQLIGLQTKLAAAITSSSFSATEKEAATAKLKIAQDQLRAWTTPDHDAAWIILMGGMLPTVDIAPLQDTPAQELLTALLQGLSQKKPDDEIIRIAKQLPPAQIELAIRQAQHAADQFEKLCSPVNDLAKRVRSWLTKMETLANQLPALDAVQRPLAGCRATVNEYDVRRYRAEGIYNTKIAELLECRVWRSGMESDRHRNRSQLFFYSMLIAQIGVTISSLALAQARRNGLWFVAALAGILALGFSAWVYLT